MKGGYSCILSQNLLWTLVQNVSNTKKDYILNPSSETSSAKGLFQILVTDRAKNDDNNTMVAVPFITQNNMNRKCI